VGTVLPGSTRQVASRREIHHHFLLLLGAVGGKILGDDLSILEKHVADGLQPSGGFNPSRQQQRGGREGDHESHSRETARCLGTPQDPWTLWSHRCTWSCVGTAVEARSSTSALHRQPQHSYVGIKPTHSSPTHCREPVAFN